MNDDFITLYCGSYLLVLLIGAAISLLLWGLSRSWSQRWLRAGVRGTLLGFWFAPTIVLAPVSHGAVPLPFFAWGSILYALGASKMYRTWTSYCTMTLWLGIIPIFICSGIFWIVLWNRYQPDDRNSRIGEEEKRSANSV